MSNSDSSDPYNYIFRYVENPRTGTANCNTPGCGKPIFFDDRYLHPISKRLAQLETPHRDGGPKPRRHYCIRNQYVSKDNIINSTPPIEEVLGHLLAWQDRNVPDWTTNEFKFHCDVCRKNWFWFTNYYLQGK